MKAFIRVMSLILALLMVMPIVVACNKPDDQKDPNGTVASTTNQDGKSELPQIDWDGAEYRVLGRGGAQAVFDNFEVDRDELPEDVVGVAVWNRNNAIKSKYNLDVVGTFEKTPIEQAKTFIDAGDDLYDLILCPNNMMQPFASAGQLVNLKGLEYINFDHECWNDYANKQLTFGGKLYYTTNKFLLEDKHRTWVVWYNRTLAAELGLGKLEQEVFDGTWTMDRYIEIAKTCSAETDGSDGMTSEDRWGVVLSAPANFSVLAYSCGFRLSDMQPNGYPSLVGATDRMMSILDKVMLLTSDTQSCFIQKLRPTTDENNVAVEELYREGRAVTMLHCVSWLSNLFRVPFEYGILPTPKYDEAQEDYYCSPNPPNGVLLAIPSTVNDLNKAAFGLEAISEESVETSYKAYIEEKCKLQVAFDEDMSKCLNIVFDNIVYDIAFLDDYGELKTKVLDVLVKESGNVYASQYRKYEKRAKHEIESIKEAYAALPY